MQWLLVDGNNWYAADYFASGTKAANNFMRRVATMRHQFNFDRVAICWDSKNSFRRQLSPTYKTHRGAKPDGYEYGLAQVKDEVLDAGLDSIEVEGFEGDDVVAALVQCALDEGVRAVMASGDKDLHQLLAKDLVTQVTKINRVSRDRLAVNTINEDAFIAKYGLRPSQWVDYRVMVGDASDGILGFDGVGPTAALKVMQSCQTLERFYLSPFSAPIGKHARALMLKYKSSVDDLRQLLTLRRDCPLPASWYRSLQETAS